MHLSPLHLLVLALVVLVLCGRGKVSSLMGEFGKGITAFKQGVKEGNEELERSAADQAKDVTPPPAAADADKDKV